MSVPIRTLVRQIPCDDGHIEVRWTMVLFSLVTFLWKAQVVQSLCKAAAEPTMNAMD